MDAGATAVPDTDWHVDKLYAFARDARRHRHGGDAFALRRRSQPRSGRRGAVRGRGQHRARARRARSTTRRSGGRRRPRRATRSTRGRARTSRPTTTCSPPRSRASGSVTATRCCSTRTRSARTCRDSSQGRLPDLNLGTADGTCGRRGLARLAAGVLASDRGSRRSSTAASRAAGSPATTGGRARACTRSSSRSRNPRTWTSRRHGRGTPRARRRSMRCCGGWSSRSLHGAPRLAREAPLQRRRSHRRVAPARPAACTRTSTRTCSTSTCRRSSATCRPTSRAAGVGRRRGLRARAGGARGVSHRAPAHRDAALPALRRGQPGDVRALLEVRRVALSVALGRLAGSSISARARAASAGGGRHPRPAPRPGDAATMTSQASAPAASSTNGPNHSSQVVRLDRRPVEHEIAVARDHVLADLVVALARDGLRAHLAAQVLGERRVGVGDRLVLAHEAAQLLREALQARLERGIGRRLRRARPARRARARRQRARRRASRLLQLAHERQDRLLAAPRR